MTVPELSSTDRQALSGLPSVKMSDVVVTAPFDSPDSTKVSVSPSPLVSTSCDAPAYFGVHSNPIRSRKGPLPAASAGISAESNCQYPVVADVHVKSFRNNILPWQPALPPSR